MMMLAESCLKDVGEMSEQLKEATLGLLISPISRFEAFAEARMPH